MKFFLTIIMLFILICACTRIYSQLWKQYSDSAKFYSDNNKYDSAISLYNKAIKAFSPDSAKTLSYILVCNDLGSLHLDEGDYQEAERLFLQAKQIEENILGKEDTIYAKGCDNLANVYYLMGKYDKAESLYLEAKKIGEEIFGKESIYYAASCNSLGNLYSDMGLYNKSEYFYLEAKKIREQILGKENIGYARICNNLAIFYLNMGKYEKAEPLYLESKKIKEKIAGKENIGYARACNNLAIFYMTLGQYKKAEPLLVEESIILKKILGTANPDYAYCCSSLADLYSQTGEFEKAESYYLEAKKIQEKTIGREHPDYAANCNNLADLYATTGQYKKAENLYLEVRQVWEKGLGKEHPYCAENAYRLANLYKDLHEYKKAEALYLEAKKVREGIYGKEHIDYYANCINLADLYRIMKRPEEAYNLYAEAYISQTSRLKNIFQFTSEVEKQSYLKKSGDFTDYFFSFCTSAYGHTSQLSYNVSLSNRNLILSSSQQLRAAVYHVNDTSIKRKYDNWINLREQLAFWYTKPLAERPDYVKDLEEQANTLEKELTRISSAFQKKQAQNDITWKIIQQNLKPNEAAIEFVKFHFYNGRRWTDSTYYIALLLTKSDTTPKLIPLFEEKQLNNSVKAGNTYSTIAALYKKEKANAAYNLIWTPLEKHLTGITKIYFAPAGLLYRISLSALQTNDHEVLSDKYQLIQLNSTASVVNQSENSIDTSDKIYVYGGIRYDVDSATIKQAVAGYHIKSENKSFIPAYATRGNELVYLPYTEKEISNIENQSAQKNYSVVVFSGTSASEESIKALNGTASPSVLHIATHGFFFPDPKEKTKNNAQYETESGSVFQQSDNPLFRSGLLLSGANAAWKGKPVEGVEDGVLTAYEVSNLYLPNTKLVVLSACETGLGDIQSNEGVYGLQRAFKIAGVQNLVMSLWKVPDKETSEFMQKFYKNIFNKQSISDAFYNAQTIMKNKYRNEPYKWAAWVLVR